MRVTDCITGTCDCRSATECRFARCKNCDYPINLTTGKTLIDHYCESEKLEVCPDCDGPLNENKIYGSLVD